MASEPFTFKQYKYRNELKNSYLDLNYVNGTYASDGERNLFVKDGLEDHVFHQFTLSNDCDYDDNTIEYHRLHFTIKPRDDTSHDQFTRSKLTRFKDMAYYKNHLYLYSPDFDKCLVYNCKDLYWYLETFFAGQWIAIRGDDYIFVHYKDCIIVFYNYDVIVFSITGSKHRLQHPNVSLDSRNVLNTHLPRAHAIIQDRYLLVINQSHKSPSAHIINLDTVAAHGKNNRKLKPLHWTKVFPFDLTQGLGELYLKLQDIYCLYSKTSDNILICNVNAGVEKHLVCRIYDHPDRVILTCLKEKSNINWSGKVYSSVKLNKGLGKQDWHKKFTYFLLGNRIVVIPYKMDWDHSGNVTCIYVSCVWPCSYGERYMISNKIGLGGSSQVYLGQRLTDKSSVVIKQMSSEDSKMYNNQEETIYTKLKTNQLSWISCDFYECIRENKRTYLIFEKLGVSLQHLINEKNDKNKTMGLDQVLGILDRMIVILCKLHSIGYIHNDIKPENILIGNNENDLRSNKIYLIDFGIATPFWNFKNNKHLKIKTTNVPFNGTFRFSSSNHHCNGFSTSRRDDLESLIYLAIYLLCGKLPWVKNRNNIMTKQEILTKTKMLKQKSSPHDTCQGLPPPFEIGLIYLQALKFDEKPNYSYLQKLFRKLYINRLQTQLITANALLNEVRVVDGKKYYDEKNDGATVVSIDNLEFFGSVDFLGSYVPIAKYEDNDYQQPDKLREKKSNKTQQAMNDNGMMEYKQEKQKRGAKDLISQKLTDIAVKQLNQMEESGTITNHPTHMSVYGMRNRFGYLIDSLTINEGVPNKIPRKMIYGGIVIYKKSDSDSSKNKLNGQIYMLSSTECKTTNEEYRNRTGQTLRGIVHGAIYYYYFKQNIHNTNNKNGEQHELSFIRGFSLSLNGELKCRSGAFNFIGFKLIDDKYKPLAKCEEKFIDFALKRYWYNEKYKITTFDQFINYGQYSNVDAAHAANENNEDSILNLCNSHDRDVGKVVPEHDDNDVDARAIEVYSKLDYYGKQMLYQLLNVCAIKIKLKYFVFQNNHDY